MPRIYTLKLATCPYCAVEMNVQNLQQHKRACLWSPGMQERIREWVLANCTTNEYGDKIFPVTGVYAKNHPPGTPSYTSILNQVGSYEAFAKMIAPEMRVLNSGGKDINQSDEWNELGKPNAQVDSVAEMGIQRREEDYPTKGLPYVRKSVQAYFDRTGRFVRDEVVYVLR